MMSEPSTFRPLDAPGVAGAVLCCALWGGNAVAAKFAIPDLPPLGCAAIRFLVGLPIVALACRRLGGGLWPRREHWGLLAIHAALSATQIGSFNWGTAHSEAGRSSVFINIHPLVVAPLAWIVLGERMGLAGFLGLGSAALGVAVLLAEPLGRGGGLKGDLVVIASGIVFGVQTIAQKKTFPMIAPTTLLFAQTALAMPLTLAASLAFEGASAYHLTPRAFWAVLYMGLAVSGACFSLWMVLLRTYPAGRLATIAFLTPIFGVGLGAAMRGELLTWPLLVGGGLVGLGIYMVASDRTMQRAEPAPGLPGEDAP